MEAQKSKALSVRIPMREWEEIERIAKKRNMSHNKVIGMLLSVGAECHKDMERLGVIGIIDMTYYIREKLKERPAGTQLTLPL